VASRPSSARYVRRWVALGAAILTAGGVLSVVVGGTTASAGASPGTTERVSVHEDGAQAGVSSSTDADVSGDGRYVAFGSYDPLDPLDAANDLEGGESDVYVRDRANPGHTTLISRTKATLGGEGPLRIVDAPANGGSNSPSISRDGRYVAFESRATNLDRSRGGDIDDFVDVYVCDRDPNGNGVFDERVADPDRADNGTMDIVCIVIGRREVDASTPPQRITYGYEPSLSADGRTVAWNQTPYAGAHPDPEMPPFSGVVATQLPKDANGGLLPPPEDSYVNLVFPLAGTVYRGSSSPQVSGDGRHVAALVFYRGIEPDDDGTEALMEVTLSPDGGKQVHYDRMDVDANGRALATSLCCIPYGITEDGGKVSFSYTPDTPDGSGTTVAMVTTRVTPDGPVGAAVSLNNAGVPDEAGRPTLSGDGRYVAYETAASGMSDGVDDETGVGPCNGGEGGLTALANTCTDIVVRDLTVDAARRAAALPVLPGELASPSLLPDCVATPADLPAGATCEGDGRSASPSLSDDGTVVGFDSGADDLVRGDTNNANDVFVRTFQPTLAGDPLNFGVVDLGTSAIGTATVRHLGFGPLAVGEVALGGPDVADFAVVTDACTGVAMYQGEVCGVSIRFTPSAVGERHATLTVTPRGRTPVAIDVTGGVGVPADGFRASPDPLAFGQRLPLSTTGPGPVTVSNGGRLPFTVRAVTLPTGGAVFGTDYRIAQNTCVGRTIPAGGTCVIRVTFTPRGSGTRNGAVQVVTVQQGTTTLVPHVVGLTGRTPVPTVVVNPGVVAGGRITTVSGTGFAPNHAVVLAVPGLGDYTATAGADGSFAQTIMVFLHAAQGGRTLAATLPGTTVQATAPFLVVQGTFQAPDFIDRR
jgi:hypothetical protein